MAVAIRCNAKKGISSKQIKRDTTAWHLYRYISEFQFLWNSRTDQDIFAAVIVGLVINGAQC